MRGWFVTTLAVAATLSTGCAPRGAPPTPQGDVIVGVATEFGFLNVVKQRPDGSLVSCVYFSGHRPGEHYEARGCEPLPPQ